MVDPARAIAAAIAWAVVVVPVWIVIAPWMDRVDTFGFHDWDVQTSHRHLAVVSITKYHEWPSWNPYACGGFPAWGYVESGTTVVSPLLPVYLFADIRTAIRIEVLFMALLGAVGTYLAAGRFTKSHGARAFAVALFAVNGRFTLQAAAGHTWHLAYAFTPFALFFLDRAMEPRTRSRDVIGLAVAMAMLVYAGGIYPLPHTVLAVGLYAAGVAVAYRSARPLAVVAIAGVASLGLSAPKLLPMIATFRRAPRLVESTEKLDAGGLWALLTSRQQGFFDRPAPLHPYGWHEWGMYISVPGALALAAAFAATPGKREAALKVAGLVLVLLGFGAVGSYAPWTLLHAHAPVFKSQHVPSRFLYPAVLVLGLVLASGLGWLCDRAARRTRWADAVLACFALALGVDVATVAAQPMKQSMILNAPEPLPEPGPFHFAKDPPFQYHPRDWAGPMYLAMLGNTGVLNCYGTPPFDGHGAIASRDRRYRGEVEVKGAAHVNIHAWTPSSATVQIIGAPADARLVYNMNFDEGWRAVVDHSGAREAVAPRPDADRVAVAVPPGDSVVELRYRPPGMRLGVGLSVLTVLALGAAAVLRRRSAFDRPAVTDARDP